jgi:hypothetical protein
MRLLSSSVISSSIPGSGGPRLLRDMVGDNGVGPFELQQSDAGFGEVPSMPAPSDPAPGRADPPRSPDFPIQVRTAHYPVRVSLSSWCPTLSTGVKSGPGRWLWEFWSCRFRPVPAGCKGEAPFERPTSP